MSTIARSTSRIVLLAPGPCRSTRPFHEVHIDPLQHARLLASMQRLRGRVYLEDGAIDQSELSQGGLHRLAVDYESWHILALDGQEKVCGCVRYREVVGANLFQQLWIHNAAVAADNSWGAWLRRAVEAQMAWARAASLGYVEVGGWAIAQEHRCTMTALLLALTTYGLGQLLGGCLGITTATVRHHSSSILRRLGGHSLEWSGKVLPPYYDPQYDCEMEILTFDSRFPASRYAHWVMQIGKALAFAPLICCKSSMHNIHSLPTGYGEPSQSISADISAMPVI